MESRLVQYTPGMQVLSNTPHCPDSTDPHGNIIHGFKCDSIEGVRTFCCQLNSSPYCCRDLPGDHFKNIDHEALLLLIGAVVSCVLFITTIVVAFCVICKRRSHTRHKRARTHRGNVITLEDLSDEELHTRLERPPTYTRSTAMTMSPAENMYFHPAHHDVITVEPAPSYSTAMARDLGEPPPSLHPHQPGPHQASGGPPAVSFNGMYVEPPPPYQEYPEPNSRIVVCRHGGTIESHNADLTVRFQY